MNQRRRLRAPAVKLVDVYARITAAPWGIVHLALAESERPNAELINLLRQKISGLVVESLCRDHVALNPFASAVFENHIRQAGLQLMGIPAGYYLTRSGRVLGYHPANVMKEDLSGAALGGLGAWTIGTLLGVDRAGSKALKAAWQTLQKGAAARAFVFFAGIVDQTEAAEAAAQRQARQQAAQEAQRRTIDEAFRGACGLLGVAPDATEEEFKKRFRLLAKQHHPDRHSGEAQGRQTAIMSEINRACDRYKRHRGWA